MHTLPWNMETAEDILREFQAKFEAEVLKEQGAERGSTRSGGHEMFANFSLYLFGEISAISFCKNALYLRHIFAKIRLAK